MSIPVEFLGRFCQCCHCQVVDGWQYPPKISWALRHDYDCLDRATVSADGRADAHVGLQQAIVAALASAVKSKDHGPLSVRRPIVRNEYLVFVMNVLDGRSAVDEPGFRLSRLSRQRDQ